MVELPQQIPYEIGRRRLLPIKVNGEGIKLSTVRQGLNEMGLFSETDMELPMHNPSKVELSRKLKRLSDQAYFFAESEGSKVNTLLFVYFTGLGYTQGQD